MKLNWLLVFMPIGLGLDWFGANPIVVFLTSALAIVPMAKLMGDATEVLAEYLGPTIGSLLNATLGNAPEIIIASFALRAGLVDIVKSSLTGSILGNLLLGLGISFFLGGVKHRRNQVFDSKAARMSTALMTLASFGLIIPAESQFNPAATRSISFESAIVLFVVYLASLVAIFWSQRPLIGKDGVKANLKEEAVRPDEVAEHPEVGWSRNQAIGVLAAVTIGLAIMSEVLTGAIEPASESLRLNPRFTGVFMLALVGNAAELFNAIRFARKDQMDLCIGITVGASVQVGLLVAPVLVFMGAIMGKDMDLVFSPLELIAIVMSVYVTRIMINDGESTWLEGLILIGVYLLFAIAFLNHPFTETPHPSTFPAGPPSASAEPAAFLQDEGASWDLSRPVFADASWARDPLAVGLG
ncbi:calcium/proton exchanger [Singulisphaera sp. PoT]|uniref:calcium/proton exchanger n=1 Tax=Singulisphaera sp. PoT TaxID=3411797 RepID=UPI003BF5175D